jgi:hypothetical protein
MSTAVNRWVIKSASVVIPANVPFAAAALEAVPQWQSPLCCQALPMQLLRWKNLNHGKTSICHRLYLYWNTLHGVLSPGSLPDRI